MSENVRTLPAGILIYAPAWFKRIKKLMLHKRRSVIFQKRVPWLSRDFTQGRANANLKGVGIEHVWIFEKLIVNWWRYRPQDKGYLTLIQIRLTRRDKHLRSFRMILRKKPSKIQHNQLNSRMPDPKKPFKGNKQFLPSKICEQCQRPMVWRKSWAKNWDQIKYCSDACRRQAKSTNWLIWSNIFTY